VGHLNWVNMVQFSRDGHVMATASKDGSVRVSEWADGAL
jgi:WD40 repeat protein